MKHNSKFVIRLAAWCIIMLYLLLDLIIFNGPLKKAAINLQGKRSEQHGDDLARNIIARVFAKPIYLSQVDYAVDEALWRQGKSRGDISKKQRIEYRKAALKDIIDHAVLREKVELNRKKFPVNDEEIDAELLRFSSRFTSPEAYKKALSDFGFKGEKELRYRIAARIQQNNYLAEHIAPGIAVTDSEARAWYTDHSQQLTTPKLYKLRHIFLAKLEHTEAEALGKLNPALSHLKETPTDFHTLATKLSEDLRTNNIGGDLGWMTTNRIPSDLKKALPDLIQNQPSIIETTLGWHLIELTDTRPANLRPYPELKPEIIAAIETSRRKEAITQYRRKLHRRHPEKVIILPSLYPAPWTN